jgi:hypothetical protein
VRPRLKYRGAHSSDATALLKGHFYSRAIKGLLSFGVAGPVVVSALVTVVFEFDAHG